MELILHPAASLNLGISVSVESVWPYVWNMFFGFENRLCGWSQWAALSRHCERAWSLQAHPLMAP